MNKNSGIAPKGAYERKFDAEPKIDENLKRNLLLIRETFNLLCETIPFSVIDLKEIWQEDSELYEQTNEQDRQPFLKIDDDWNQTHDTISCLGMTVFYKALGIYDVDSVTAFTEEINENLKNQLEKVTNENERKNLEQKAEKEIKDIKNKELKKASDIYSKIIGGESLDRHYKCIKERLMDAGLPERYIKKSRTVLICAGNEIEASVNTYFNKEERTKKIEASKKLRQIIRDAWSTRNPKICMLVLVVYKLVYLVFPNKTQDLYTANEVLEKVLENNLPEDVKNSSTYARYITTLAKSVISVEEEFPNFYALTQQMRQEKTPQSIMDETTKILKQLQDAVEISKSDAESTSCQNMMNEIAKVMLKIQQVLKNKTIQKNPVK